MVGWSAVGGRFGAVPCRGDVLALLVEIDAAVGSWQPDGKGTVDRLHQLAGRAFRPQDCDLIGDYCSTMERWTLAGTELLTETPRVFLRQPCPRCGARFTYRRDDGCWAASRCRRDCLPGRLSQRQLSIKDHRTDHLRTMPTWSYEASEC